MSGRSQVTPAARHEFVFHVPTEQIGSVIGVSTSGHVISKAVRLAGGEIISAPDHEFRPATVAEIDMRHRAAALVRPLVLPA